MEEQEIMNIYQTQTYKNLVSKPKDNFPEWIIIHHTGSEVDSSNQTAQIVEAYHLSLGWEGIDYHEFIEKDGDVWLGRPENYHGAHVSEQSMNTKSIGICLAGNFDLTLPVPIQIENLRSRVLMYMIKYNIPISRVVPHRHFALGANGLPYKSCYGNKLSDSWITDLLSVPSNEVDILKKKLADIKIIIDS